MKARPPYLLPIGSLRPWHIVVLGPFAVYLGFLIAGWLEQSLEFGDSQGRLYGLLMVPFFAVIGLFAWYSEQEERHLQVAKQPTPVDSDLRWIKSGLLALAVVLLLNVELFYSLTNGAARVSDDLLLLVIGATIAIGAFFVAKEWFPETVSRFSLLGSISLVVLGVVIVLVTW